MKTLRSKRVLIPAAVLAAVGVAGGAWATTAAADNVTGSERDRVAAAAVDAVGEGEAVDVDTSDDRGEAYEVEVRLSDGSEVDVALDDQLALVSQDRDDDRDDWDDRDDRDDWDDRADDRDDRDADDRRLSGAERERAEQAALEAVGGGTVTDVEASDDRGVAYDVEVVEQDGTEHDVELDEAFAVVSAHEDR